MFKGYSAIRAVMANVWCSQVPCEEGSVRDTDLRAFRSMDSPSNALWFVIARELSMRYLFDPEEPGKQTCAWL